MTKLTDRTFGRLTVHADGGYSWGRERIPRDVCTVLDACFLLSPHIGGAASGAVTTLHWTGLECGYVSYGDMEEGAEYVRDNWEWSNE